MNRAYVSYARREGGEYRNRVSELTAAYYADLAEVGNRYSADFYEEVLGNGSATSPTEAITASGESATRVPMEIHGAPGKEVIARFSLENTDPDPVDAIFEVGVCRGPDGDEFTAPLSVHPARVTVPAGGREEITIRVAMLPSVFAPGQLYRTVVRVAGYRQLELDLVIWAEEPMVVFPDDLTALGDIPARVPAEPPADGFRVRCRPAAGTSPATSPRPASTRTSARTATPAPSGSARSSSPSPASRLPGGLLRAASIDGYRRSGTPRGRHPGSASGSALPAGHAQGASTEPSAGSAGPPAAGAPSAPPMSKRNGG